jgi:uncharacterized iron-regulated membrane protein
MSNLSRKVYQVHKWCGLIGALFIFILGLTGSILVFNKELEEVEHRTEWTIENSDPVSIDKAYNAVIHRYQNWDIRLKRIPANPQETAIFNLRRPTERLTVFSHPSNGRILKAINANSTFVTWLLKLHYTLHAKLFGEILVLCFGVIYFISIVTGLIVYRKALLDVLLFRIKFRAKKRRSIASLLHRSVGVWALFLNLFIIATGVLISYEVVNNGLKKATPKTEISTSEIHFSLDAALDSLKKSIPDFQPTYIRFPVTESGPVILNGRSDTQPFFYSQFYNSVKLNKVTGSIEEVIMNPNAEGRIKLSSFSRAIHFVEFGNLPIKILFFLIGLSAPLLSITGFLLWKWKAKRK